MNSMSVPFQIDFYYALLVVAIGVVLFIFQKFVNNQCKRLLIKKMPKSSPTVQYNALLISFKFTNLSHEEDTGTGSEVFHCAFLEVSTVIGKECPGIIYCNIVIC
jgi:hypothetical protein